MMRRSLPALPAFILTGVLLLWVGALHADPSFHFTAINFPGAALTHPQHRPTLRLVNSPLLAMRGEKILHRVQRLKPLEG